MTAMLSAADKRDLIAVFTEAQEDTSLVLYRLNDSTGAYDPLPAQEVQVAYPARQARPGASQGAVATLADVSFYREAPFDVRVGDAFSLDGHKGGAITRVLTDPVLGVIQADGTVDVGVPA